MALKINHVLVIAPAGRVDMKSLQSGVELLKQLGTKVELGQNLSKVKGPFAGRDAERLTDLQWALDHPKADAVWMARGGYGLTRILDQVKTDGYRLNPKLILGYSDITALFLDERFKNDILLHSAMIESITEDELDMVIDLLENEEQGIVCKSIQPKAALIGKITGGNLSLIVNQLGVINKEFFNDKILFIEEVSEYDYKIDRMMTQLQRAGIFKNIRGLMLGSFKDVQDGRFPMGTVNDSIIEQAKISGVPCFYDMPVGHIHPNHPLIFNKNAELKYTGGKLSIKYLS